MLKTNRRTSLSVGMAQEPQLPPKIVPLLRERLDLEQRFMSGWIARFHSDPPNLYLALGARQTVVVAGGQLRRVIVEAAQFLPKRLGAEPEWMIIRWCIDGLGVKFQRVASRKVALERLHRPVAADEIVFTEQTSLPLSIEECSSDPRERSSASAL